MGVLAAGLLTPDGGLTRAGERNSDVIAGIYLLGGKVASKLVHDG